MRMKPISINLQIKGKVHYALVCGASKKYDPSRNRLTEYGLLPDKWSRMTCEVAPTER